MAEQPRPSLVGDAHAPAPGRGNTISVVDTLEFAKREFVFIGGCVVTDRPDLPLSPDTSWTSDFSLVVAAIDDVIDQLVGVGRRTGLECAGCSTNQPTRPISARTKYVPAHLDSRTAAEERS
nr:MULTISPECIES: hypothetical protein [unclassified Acidovorax]